MLFIHKIHSNMFSVAYFSALSEALSHASNNTKCAHLGCSVVINDELYSTFQNNPLDHAEMNALSRLKGAGCCPQCAS